MKFKRLSVALLSLLLVLTIAQGAFAKDYAGIILGYNDNHMIILGEWKNEVALNTETSITAGIKMNFKGSFAVPAEAAIKYDFFSIKFGNTKLGTLAFGVKGDASINLAFGKETDTTGNISAGVGLYADWDITSRWKVSSDFAIIRLTLMPRVDIDFVFTNLTTVQYRFDNNLLLKGEFGYNRFVAVKNAKSFYAGVGLGYTF